MILGLVGPRLYKHDFLENALDMINGPKRIPMGWDSDDEKSTNVSNGDLRQEEVKRVKKSIEDVDVVSTVPRSVSVSFENTSIEDSDLNFKRQIKRNVNSYKYKTVYNVGKTKSPYLLTRNSVLIRLEEGLGVEILVKGTYKPEELNGDINDENALLLEISAPSPNELQEAMFKLASAVKSLDGKKNRELESIKRYFRRDGTQYHTTRIRLNARSLENKNLVSDLIESMESLALANSVEIKMRGRGSGYIEPCFGEESNEPRYVQIISKGKPNLQSVEKSIRNVIFKYK